MIFASDILYSTSHLPLSSSASSHELIAYIRRGLQQRDLIGPLLFTQFRLRSYSRIFLRLSWD